MGYLTLASLTALTWFGAACLAAKTRPEGRVEFLLTSTVLWNAMVLLPIYVLDFSMCFIPSRSPSRQRSSRS